MICAVHAAINQPGLSHTGPLGPIVFKDTINRECVCVSPCRNPIVKRPNSAVKQQRKDSPGLQHRGAAPGGRGQANPKAERPGFRDARGTKAKDDKVRLRVVDEWLTVGVAIFYFFLKLIRARKRVETEQGTSSRRSLMAWDTTATWWTHWREILCRVTPTYTGMVANTALCSEFAAGEVLFSLTEFCGWTVGRTSLIWRTPRSC